MLETKKYIGKKIQLSEGYIKRYAENPCSFPRIWEVDSQEEDGTLRVLNGSREPLILNINNNKKEDDRFFWVVDEKWQNIPLREEASQALKRLNLKPGDAVMCVDVPRSSDIDPEIQCRVWKFVTNFGSVLSVKDSSGEVRVWFPKLKEEMSLMAYTLRNLEKLPEHIDCAGKKVRLTEKGVESLRYRNRTKNEIGEIIGGYFYGPYRVQFENPKEHYTLCGPNSKDPEFEIIEEEPVDQQTAPGSISVELKPEVNYIGAKMYITEQGRELYGYNDVPLTSEWEVTEIEDKSLVTLRNKEHKYTTHAGYASLFMYSEQRDFTFEKPEHPSVKQKSTADYIGKKVRTTKTGKEFREIHGYPNCDNWEISYCEEGRNIELVSPDKKQVTYIAPDGLFGENPSFELIEEPDIQLLSENSFEKLPPPVFKSGKGFQKIPPEPDDYQHPTVLDKAKNLIYGDREKDYGKTSDNFADICTGWEIIFKNGFTPERVGLAMAWLKICRASTDNCEKEDSLVDLAGYAGCVEKIKKNL